LVALVDRSRPALNEIRANGILPEGTTEQGFQKVEDKHIDVLLDELTFFVIGLLESEMMPFY